MKRGIRAASEPESELAEVAGWLAALVYLGLLPA